MMNNLEGNLPLEAFGLEAIDVKVIDIHEEGSEERETLVKKLREVRNRARTPKTLLSLCVRAFAKTCIDLIDMPLEKSPLSNLPNAASQAFLDIISETKESFADKDLIPKEHLTKALFQILNKNITSVDSSKLALIVCNMQLGPDIFKHTLEHCPRMKYVSIANRLFQFSGQMPQVPVLQMKQAWANLRRLNLPDYWCNDNTMNLLQQNFPLLEGTEFMLCLADKSFTQEGVQHMSKMKNLVSFKTCANKVDGLPDELIDIAGQVPNLRYYDLINNISSDQNKFVEEFSVRYPNKDIIMERLVIVKGLRKPWPKNLKLKTLHLIGVMDAETVKNISSLDCNITLLFEIVDEASIELLLTKIGHRVYKLKFISEFATKRSCYTLATRGFASLDIEKVLMMCPELQSFAVKDKTMQFVQHSIPRFITPKNFKNMKSFSYCVEEPLHGMFKLFLMGSAETIEELTLEDTCMLKEAHDVLMENKNLKLKKLKILRLKLHDWSFGTQDHHRACLKSTMSLATTFVFFAPNLERILVFSKSMMPFFMDPPTTIYCDFMKAVDPNLLWFVPKYKDLGMEIH